MTSQHQTRKLVHAAVAETLENRRLLSGGLNASWGAGGVATAPQISPAASLVQPDGKLLVGGYIVTYTGQGSLYNTGFGIERFNANGSVDTSFGTNGIVTTQFAVSNFKFDQISDLALQSNGDIVAVGLALPQQYNAWGNIVVARYTPSGTLDPSFGTGGEVVLPAQSSAGTTVAIQPNGGIIIGYVYSNYPQTVAQNIIRLNSNGTQDSSFGTYASGIDGSQVVMAVDSGGNVLFDNKPTGYIGQYYPQRLNAGGQLDSTYHPSGVYLSPSAVVSYTQVMGQLAVAPALTSMAIEPNGDLLVAGTAEYDDDDNFYPYLARYNSNGSFDTSFNTTGYEILSTLRGEYFRSVTILPDGNIAGVIGAAGTGDAQIVQFLPGGAPDNSFGTNGIATQTVLAFSESESFPITFGGLSGLANGNLILTGTSPTQSGTVAAEFLGDMPTLAFTGSPTNAVVGSTLNVQVTVESSTGQPLANGDTITLSLGNNPGSASLGGNVTATAVNGVASFSNITISAIGSGYTLVATDSTSTGIASATSTAFNVGPASTNIPAGATLPISNSSSGHSVFVTGGLTIAGSTRGWTGTLDLTNNDADIINGSLATITNQAQQGYAGGTWLGKGITSSTAAADTAHLTALGVIQNNQSGGALYTSTNQLDGTTPGAGDILVKFTYYGDTNLDGKVDGTDYSRIDNGYLSKLTGWFNGDFNYDGVVNGSDYTLIDNAYEMQGASLAAQPTAQPASQIMGDNLYTLASPSPGAVPTAPPVVDSSGNIFGVTSSGGTSNDGIIYEIPRGGTAAQTLVNLNSSTGYPANALVMDHNGNLFGTTAGSASVNGTVFEIPKNTTTLTTLTTLSQFATASGLPNGSLVVDSHNNIFGSTSEQVFEVAAGSSSATDLASFSANSYSGAVPSLISVDSAGDVFGLANSNTGQSAPYAFEIPAGTNTPQTLVTLPTSGAYATTALGADAAGDLFGVTQYGGTSSLGTIFEIPHGSGTIDTLASFTSATGGGLGQITVDSNGDAFGVTAGVYNVSGSQFYELAHGSSSITSLSSFPGSTQNRAGLTVDSKGDIFDTTAYGGMGEGSVVELPAGSSTLKTLAEFDGATLSIASAPNANGIFQNGVAVDPNGNLFGTTQLGGASNSGTIFEIPSGSTTLQTVANFPTDNGEPIMPNGINIDANGNIFGSTYYGKQDTDLGTIFTMPAGTTTLNLNDILPWSSYAHPVGTAAVDSAGNFFGVANLYGGGGFIYKLAAGAAENEYIILANFSSPNAAYGVTLDSKDNVYYVTTQGGTNSMGAIMELVNGSAGAITLASFNGTNGSDPNAPLVRDSAGDLFGTTAAGEVYELPFGTNTTIAPLANLGTASSALTIDSSGDLFGTTKTGGAYGQGSVYEISAGTSTVTTLVSFNGSNGAYPTAPVSVGSNGIIYGTTSAGGNGLGTVFSLNPQTQLTVAAGTTVTLPPSQSHTALVFDGISIAGSTSAWTGTLDITNNDLDIVGGSLPAINNQIAQGYSGGSWTGPGGITSTLAAGDGSHLTGVGVIQNNQDGTPVYSNTHPFYNTSPAAGDVLVKYTYYGDANLDGKVDGSDYSLADNGYLNKLTGWLNGDFNYDGVVNGSDYTLIDNAYQMQGASLAAMPAAQVASKTRLTLTATLFSTSQIVPSIGNPDESSRIAKKSLASEILG